MPLKSPLDNDDDETEVSSPVAEKVAAQARKRAAKKTTKSSRNVDRQEHNEPASTSGNTEPTSESGLSEGGGTVSESRNPEIQNSVQTSGNPEIQNSGNPETGTDVVPTEETSDYLGSVYGGVTDPYEDFVKISLQAPLCIKYALKAAAPMEGTSVQQMVTDIFLGRRPPITESHPGIVKRFYKMAQQGKLKR